MKLNVHQYVTRRNVNSVTLKIMDIICQLSYVSPHDEHQYSGPRPAKPCSVQQILQSSSRYIQKQIQEPDSDQ